MPGLLVGVRRKQGAVCLCSLLIYRPFILLILIVQQNIKKVNWQEQGKRIENWRTKLDSVIRFKYSVSLVALLEVISRGSCVGRFQIIFSCLFFVLISNISPHFCCGLSPFSVLVWKKIFLDTCDGFFFIGWCVVKRPLSWRFGGYLYAFDPIFWLARDKYTFVSDFVLSGYLVRTCLDEGYVLVIYSSSFFSPSRAFCKVSWKCFCTSLPCPLSSSLAAIWFLRARWEYLDVATSKGLQINSFRFSLQVQRCLPCLLSRWRCIGGHGCDCLNATECPNNVYFKWLPSACLCLHKKHN